MKNIIRTNAEKMSIDRRKGTAFPIIWSWSFPENYASKCWFKDGINSLYEEYRDCSLWDVSPNSYKISSYF